MIELGKDIGDRRESVAGAVTQAVECLRTQRAPSSGFAPHTAHTRIVVHACSPSTPKVKTGGSDIQS